MKKLYVCEKCGEKYDTERECDRHEKKCRNKTLDERVLELEGKVRELEGNIKILEAYIDMMKSVPNVPSVPCPSYPNDPWKPVDPWKPTYPGPQPVWCTTKTTTIEPSPSPTEGGISVFSRSASAYDESEKGNNGKSKK